MQKKKRLTVKSLEELERLGDADRYMFEVTETGERIIVNVSRTAIVSLKGEDPRKLAAQAVSDSLLGKLTPEHYSNGEIRITSYDYLDRRIEDYAEFVIELA